MVRYDVGCQIWVEEETQGGTLWVYVCMGSRENPHKISLLAQEASIVANSLLKTGEDGISGHLPYESANRCVRIELVSDSQVRILCRCPMAIVLGLADLQGILCLWKSKTYLAIANASRGEVLPLRGAAD